MTIIPEVISVVNVLDLSYFRTYPFYAIRLWLWALFSVSIPEIHHKVLSDK